MVKQPRNMGVHMGFPGILSSYYNPGWWFGCHFLFSHILGIIIPIDVHIFERGGPTTNQNHINHIHEGAAFWNILTMVNMVLHDLDLVWEEKTPLTSQETVLGRGMYCQPRIHKA